MANNERPQNKNLEKGKATRFQSGEQAVNAGHRGGIASGAARREKADFKKKCQMWMESEVAKDKKGNPMTGADLMIAVAGKGIKEGSTRFWELMRDTAGYKPIDKVMVADVDQNVIDEVEAAVLGAEEDDERTSN